MNRERKISEIMRWAEVDLDNDTDALDEYEKLIRSFHNKILDDEYNATVGEWERSL